MTSKITFARSSITNCGTVFDIAHGADVEITMEDSTISQCGRAVLQRDPPSALSALGLPPDTPPEYLREVFGILRGIPDSDTKSKEAAVKASQLWGFIQNSANAAVVVQAIVSLSSATATGLAKIF